MSSCNHTGKRTIGETSIQPADNFSSHHRRLVTTRRPPNDLCPVTTGEIPTISLPSAANSSPTGDHLRLSSLFTEAPSGEPPDGPSTLSFLCLAQCSAKAGELSPEITHETPTPTVSPLSTSEAPADKQVIPSSDEDD